MGKAIVAVVEKKMGWLRASREFNVPQATLRRRAQNKNKVRTRFHFVSFSYERISLYSNLNWIICVDFQRINKKFRWLPSYLYSSYQTWARWVSVSHGTKDVWFLGLWFESWRSSWQWEIRYLIVLRGRGYRPSDDSQNWRLLFIIMIFDNLFYRHRRFEYFLSNNFFEKNNIWEKLFLGGITIFERTGGGEGVGRQKWI